MILPLRCTWGEGWVKGPGAKDEVGRMKDEGERPLLGFILPPSSFILPEEPLTPTPSPEYRGEGAKTVEDAQ